MHPYDIQQLKKQSEKLRVSLSIKGPLFLFLLEQVHAWLDGQESCSNAFFQKPLDSLRQCDSCQNMAYSYFSSPYTPSYQQWCIDCIIDAYFRGDDHWDKYADPLSPEYDANYAFEKNFWDNFNEADYWGDFKGPLA